MMGFLMSAFGLQNLILAKSIIKNKAALLAGILISGTSFVIAFIYFHILAFGFIFFSLLWFSFSPFLPEGKVVQAKRAF